MNQIRDFCLTFRKYSILNIHAGNSYVNTAASSLSLNDEFLLQENLLFDQTKSINTLLFMSESI